MPNIGVIGGGNMGTAIIRGMIDSDYIKPQMLFIFDKSSRRMHQLSEELPGVNFCESEEEVCCNADMLILAVKPYILADVIDTIKDCLNGKAVISIAAGWTVKMLDKHLTPCGATYLRVMPNTPAMVGEGMTALCDETTFSPSDFEFAKGIFNAIGRTAVLPEREFDGVIAISGSSPAYVYMMIEALADGGVREGIPRQAAIEMAAQAVLGSALMVLQSGQHPAELKDAVTSPAGTTIEALAALEECGFRNAILKAMKACADKSRDMAKGK